MYKNRSSMAIIVIKRNDKCSVTRKGDAMKYEIDLKIIGIVNLVITFTLIIKKSSQSKTLQGVVVLILNSLVIFLT